MLTTTLRPLTKSEKQLLTQKLPTRYERWEQCVISFICSVALLLIPALAFNYFLPVPNDFQAAYSIAVVIGGVLIMRWLSDKERTLLKSVSPLASGLVEVVQVQTSRAVKREDPEDFGAAYYLSISTDDELQTLYLQGQYLDELEYEGLFPNTSFTFSRLLGSPEFLTFEVLGQYFEPERTVPAFSKEVWQSGLHPVNGQLLPEPLDSVI